MTTILENHKEAIGKLSHKYSVQWLFVFGSDIRGDSQPRESDVDLLIKFAPISHRVKLHAFLICLMSQGPPGTKSDLVVRGPVCNAIIAREIEKTKRRVYASMPREITAYLYGITDTNDSIASNLDAEV